MAEQRQIPTLTNITVKASSLTAYTYYTETTQEILSAFISEDVAKFNFVDYVEGELIFTFLNGKINAYLDNNGNLILYSNSIDLSKYSLDQLTGELIYTES